MKTNAVLVAISKGGVTITKEVVIGLDDEAFMKQFADFQKKNGAYYCTFFTEREFMELLRLIEQKKGGSVIIG